MRTQRGFSIIEIAVSIGMVSVMTLGSLALVDNLLKAVRTTETQQQLSDFITKVKYSLSSNDVCVFNLNKAGYFKEKVFDNTDANLKNQTININELHFPNDKLIVGKTDATKAVPGIANANVSSLVINDIVDISPAASPKTLYLAQLAINIEKGGRLGSTFGAPSYNRTIPLFLQANAVGNTSTINGCSASGSENPAQALQMACDSIGGTFNTSTLKCSASSQKQDCPCPSGVYCRGAFKSGTSILKAASCSTNGATYYCSDGMIVSVPINGYGC